MDKARERNELVSVIQRTFVFLYELMKSGNVTRDGRKAIKDHLKNELEEGGNNVSEGNIPES